MSHVGSDWNEFFIGFVFPSKTFAHNDDVILTFEWVRVVAHWPKNDLRVLCRRHEAAATIKVPLRQLAEASHLLDVEGPLFRSYSLRS